TNGHPASELMRHFDIVNAAHFSADGQLVATASDDGTARLWNARTGRSFSEPARLLRAVDDALFTADLRHLIAFPDSGAPRIYKMSAGISLLPARPLLTEEATNLNSLK